MLKTGWLLAVAMLITAAALALIAFRASEDHSALALVHWGVIALSLALSPWAVRELHSTTPVDPIAARARIVRVVLLMYLPLTSALSLLAFRGR
ncbi:MAG TPA: hypothetical protein VKB50_22315 [Vicinamibacterales bacterium]|nr:hypothetical protein [Vicinamibacterales bacterium]